ncbi:hypothetical protein [Paractinoplanes lichenicola]|uniref:Uncharacterized protein n=1 Tax=Paractinoplanes lichenicola TaxID=2802976 RepID=A0ABS1W1Z4_9ACTN|nr:hypothetical protein [Actinoplanes lichenicola]MBL7260753.1 hypothetical protein [Actinoplanes lichenicola]
MTTLTTRPSGGYPDRGEPPADHRSGVARAALVAGGSFTTAIGAILASAGMWGLGDRTILYALVALCVIAALTMFTAAIMMRR